MNGLLQRIRRRRADRPVVQQGEQPTLIAGAETEPPPGAPGSESFRERGRLRRRLRYLRRVRELGFRDLGGLVFDQHRFARPNDELVQGKLAALAGVDKELRGLERALDDRRPFHELREPGIAACPRCGALHGSDARFCPSCGTPLTGPRAIGEVGGPAPSVAVGEIGTLSPASPSSEEAQPALPGADALNAPGGEPGAGREGAEADASGDQGQPTQVMAPVEDSEGGGGPDDTPGVPAGEPTVRRTEP